MDFFLFYACSYLLLLGLCLLLRLFFADRRWWLGLLNSFSLYWFAPLITVVPIAIFARRPYLWFASLLALTVFLALYGSLFLPAKWRTGLHRAPPLPSNPLPPNSLSVLTYNLLQSNTDGAAVVATLREADADLVALQELNAEIAAALERELAEDYPYRLLEGAPIPPANSWSGLLSRYPARLLENAGERLLQESLVEPLRAGTPGVLAQDWLTHLSAAWSSRQKVFQIDFSGFPILLINAHGYPVKLGTLDLAFVAWAARAREQQARALADFAARQNCPLIMATDFNTTDQNRPYCSLTQTLVDSWREAGWGFGHTFGLRQHTFGAERPISLFSLLPRWLLRIDYIFHSRHWVATHARLGRWDGVSDHRPVIATLEAIPHNLLSATGPNPPAPFPKREGGEKPARNDVFSPSLPVSGREGAGG